VSRAATCPPIFQFILEIDDLSVVAGKGPHFPAAVGGICDHWRHERVVLVVIGVIVASGEGKDEVSQYGKPGSHEQRDLGLPERGHEKRAAGKNSARSPAVKALLITDRNGIGSG
jgi:hypothetical protein